MEAVYPEADAPVLHQPTFIDLLAGGLLALTVILHVVALFPHYFGGASGASLWSQSDQAAAFTFLAAGWALALVVGLTSPARAGLAAGLAVGVAVTEFGFRLSDLGYVFRYGSSQAGPGLWLMTVAWVVGAAGATAAVLAARRRHRQEPRGSSDPLAPLSLAGATPLPSGQSEEVEGLWWDPKPEESGSLAATPAVQVRDPVEAQPGEPGSTRWDSNLVGSGFPPPPAPLEARNPAVAQSPEPWPDSTPGAGSQRLPETPEQEARADTSTPDPLAGGGSLPAQPTDHPDDVPNPAGLGAMCAASDDAGAATQVAPGIAGSDSLAPSYRRAGVVLVAVLAAATAGAFLPAWDHYTGVVTTTGRAVGFSAGNAFSAPWQVVVGTVLVAVAILVLPILVSRLKARPVAAAVVAGSLIVLASQFVDAIVQLDQPIPPSIISPGQASQLGLQLHMGLTGWFTVDLIVAFALFAVTMVLGHLRVVPAPAEHRATPVGTWPSGPDPRRPASLPGS
jgi:hypothetical protein